MQEVTYQNPDGTIEKEIFETPKDTEGIGAKLSVGERGLCMEFDRPIQTIYFKRQAAIRFGKKILKAARKMFQ